MDANTLLNDNERLAGLGLDELKQLVGLVEYDPSADPFPVSGWDALVWIVGNAVQTVHFLQSAFGMELVAYSGPETGNRDHHAYVLRSGAARFVIKGAYDPASPLADHHRAHGDGIVDIALAVPDVDRCVAHASAQGAVVLEQPHDVSDEHGTVRLATIAAYGDTVHTLVDRSRYNGPYLPGYVREVLRPHPAGRTRRGGSSRPSTTWSATSSSARWTSGSTSTTGSWGSPTWPSSSATTSPPTTPP